MIDVARFLIGYAVASTMVAGVALALESGWRAFILMWIFWPLATMIMLTLITRQLVITLRDRNA